MAQQADGTVYIDTLLDTTGFQAGGKEVEASVRKMAQTVSGLGKTAKIAFQKQADTFVKQNQAVDQQKQKVESLKNKLKELGEQKIETAEFKELGKELERLEKEFNDLSKKRITEPKVETDAYNKINAEYNALIEKGNELNQNLKNMRSEGIGLNSAHYLETYKRLKAIYEESEKLRIQAEQMESDGSAWKMSEEYAAWKNQIDNVSSSIENVKQKIDSMKSSGAAYQTPDTSGTEQKLFYEEQRLQNMTNSLTTSFQSLKAKYDSSGNSALNLAGISKRLESVLKSVFSAIKRVTSMLGGSLVSGIKKLGSAMFGLDKSTKSTNRSFGSSLKTMLKYSLGIRSLYTLFNRLRSTIKDSLSTLAQYSSETKANISSMSSELNRLKGSLATAFEPVLNTIAPIISSLISMLADAITAIGMFFAALSGRGTYMRAVAGAASTISGTGTAISTIGAAAKNSAVQIGTLASTTERAASATQKTASATKEAAKETKKAKKENDDYLSGLDEIRRWESKDDGSGGDGGGGGGGGGGAGGGGISFVEDSIPELFTGLADLIKDAWKNADFTELGGIIGGKLRDALNSIPWDEIKEAARKVAKSLATFLNGFFETPGLAESIGRTVGEAINTGIAFADEFINNFHFDSLGTFLAEAMNEAIDTIRWSELGKTIRNGLNGIFELAETWSGKFHFKQLGTAVKDLINSTLTGIKWAKAVTAAKNIGEGIADALNEVINPTTFGKIGTTLAGTVVTVISGVKSWVNKSDFYTWGVSLGTALNDFFNSIDWEDVGLTLDSLIGGLVDFMKGLVDSGQFESFAEKIGTALSQVNWLGHLFDAGRAILNAIRDILVGGASTPAGRFIEALGMAFVAAKMASHIYKFVDGIKTILCGDRNTRVLRQAMEEMLGRTAETAAKTATTTVSDVGKAASGASGMVGLLKMALFGIGEASTLAGIVFGAQKISEFTDSARGGNGQLSEMGGIIDSLSGQFSGELSNSLFQTKENLENANASTGVWAETLSQFFIDAGVGATELQSAYGNVAGQINVTSEQASLMEQVIQNVKDTESTWSAETKQHVLDNESAYQILNDMLKTLQQEGIIPSSEHMQVLQQELEKSKTSGYDATTAFENLKTRMGEMNLSANDPNGIINGVMDQALKDITTDADQASVSTEKVGKKADNANDSFLKTVIQLAAFVLGLGGVKSGSKDAESGIGSLDAKISGFIKNLAQYAKETTTKGKEAGKNYPTGMSKGIDEGENLVTTSGKNMASSLNKTVRSELGISSPSTVAKGYGKDYDSGLANGIKGSQSTVETAAKQLLSALKKLFTSEYENFKKFGQTFMTKLKSGINSEKQNVYSAGKDVVTKLKSAFDGLDGTMRSKGQTIMQAFVNGMKSVRIPRLQIDFTTSVSRNGDSVTTSSSSHVNWYGKGGLFSAPSVIGVGEAGKEAVLPIESRPVMAKLANSIVSGLSTATLQKVPVMATGAIIPPRAARSSDSTELQHTVASLNNILDKLSIPKNGTGAQDVTIRIPVILDGRQVFESVITEAKLKQMISGRNPFEMA